MSRDRAHPQAGTGGKVLPMPERDDAERAAGLAAELDRVAVLIRALQRHREGKPAGADLKRDLEVAQARIDTTRAMHFWRSLLPTLSDAGAERLARDAVAVALYPVLRPSALNLVATLQGSQGDGHVTQAFVHELLMASPEEEAGLMRLFSPVSPLRVSGLLRIEGEGALRRVAPGPALLRLLVPDDAFSDLPSGMRLTPPGPAPTGFVYSDRTRLQIDEVVALARYQQSHADAAGGPAVLFVGPPGTGKSLAARHIAEGLGRPLFQLDLGGIVSKWVGETEKNLTRVFERMSGTRGCILVDEADVVLGKRVATKGERDHFVNMTVSHLLTLMEQHRGLVMLTTNLRNNLDDAFLRRFAAVVEFYAPEAELRARMWAEALTSLPTSIERAQLAAMAASVDMTGAEIGNAVRLAAALAHAANGPVTPALVARAVWRERTKATLTFTHGDMRQLAPHLGVLP